MNTDTPILLRPKRAKWLFVGLGSLAFALASASLVRSGSWVAWPSTVFFGLCFLVSVVYILPRAAYLRLTSEGFTICSLFRAHAIRWAEVEKFAVGRVLLHKMVMFNFEGSAGPFPRSPALRSLNVKLCGFEAGLPDTYGLTHEELADLLNAYKATARSA